MEGPIQVPRGSEVNVRALIRRSYLRPRHHGGRVQRYPRVAVVQDCHRVTLAQVSQVGVGSTRLCGVCKLLDAKLATAAPVSAITGLPDGLSIRFECRTSFDLSCLQVKSRDRRHQSPRDNSVHETGACWARASQPMLKFCHYIHLQPDEGTSRPCARELSNCTLTFPHFLPWPPVCEKRTKTNHFLKCQSINLMWVELTV